MNPMLRTTLAILLAAVAVELPAAAQARDGSIYDPSAGPYGLVSNKIAQRVGDLITVVISENQNVRNEEIADLRKETDLQYQITNFDIKPNAFNVLPQVAADSTDQFAGQANYAPRTAIRACSRPSSSTRSRTARSSSTVAAR